jgi:hypothetical protein
VTLQWDPNSEPDLSYYVVHWGSSSGSYSEDSGDIGLVTSYTCPLPDDGNTYYFAVTAVDDSGLSSDYSNEVNTGDIGNGDILDGNPPTANAGPDQNVNEGSFIYLDGSGSSDPDGDDLSFQWVQTGGAAVTLNDPNTAKPSVVSSQDIPLGETLTFQLTVTDAGGLKSTDQCSVTVMASSHYDITGDLSSLYPIERKKKSWISAGCNISNFGSQINNAFNVSFYISDNSSFDSGDTRIYSQVVSALGEYETVNVALNNIKVEDFIIGKYIICIVDSGDQIAEDNESNNMVVSLIQSY